MPTLNDTEKKILDHILSPCSWSITEENKQAVKDWLVQLDKPMPPASSWDDFEKVRIKSTKPFILVNKEYKAFDLKNAGESFFKIDVDNVTDDDLSNIAWLFSRKFKYGYVFSVPSGGDRLAKFLRTHIDSSSQRILLVDDVLTTGTSMEEYRAMFNKDREILGVVLFSRGETPNWIIPLLTLTKHLW